MGRKMRTNIPILDEKLMPELPDYHKFRECDKQFKLRQKYDYGHCHAVHPLPSIPDNTQVWINTEGRRPSGQVVSGADTPRSYEVQTNTGTVRRNRHHLTVRPRSPVSHHQTETSSEQTDSMLTRNCIMTRSQTGTMTRPSQRFRRGDIGTR